MHEILDIWDENGCPTGNSASKDYLHQKGLFHPTVHIWFYKRTPAILLQKRGPNKQTFPNLWDVSVAGHVAAGETVLEAALREIKEEIGLEVRSNALELLRVQKNINKFPNGINDCEFQHVYLCELPVDVTVLKLQSEELEAVRLFSFEEINQCQLGKHKDFKIVPADMEYYSFIIQCVKDKIML